jgi:tripartite ATP-independent transporter DctM subunit
VPLFILTGQIMNYTGITERIINLASALVGHIRGGLAIVNVVASMFFAGISGSAVADTASLGSVLIPSMKKRGYSGSFSAAVTSSSGTIGIIIPPSNAVIIHGMVAGVSVGKLFMAGVIPGILVGFSMMALCYVIATKRRYPIEHAFSFARLARATWHATPAIVLPFIILGGIISGVFTPTEAAGISVVYALVVSLFLFRTLNFRKLYRLLVHSAEVTAVIMIIIATSMLLGWVLSHARVPRAIVALFVNLQIPSSLLVVFVTIFLIIAGTFLHGAPIQLIIVPLLLPLMNSIGVDPLLFGMLVVFCVGIGQQTPPVGSALYVTSALSGADIIEVTRDNIPFIGVIIAIMYLILLVPEIALFLPRIIFG